MTSTPGDRGEYPDLTVRWPGAEPEVRTRTSNRTDVRIDTEHAEPVTVDDGAGTTTKPAAEGRRLLRLRLPVEHQTPHNHAGPTPVAATASEGELHAEIRSLRTEAAWLREEVDRLRQRVKELEG